MTLAFIQRLYAIIKLSAAFLAYSADLFRIVLPTGLETLADPGPEFGGHMVSTAREPIYRGSGDRAPCEVQRQSLWSGGEATLKLNAFLYYHSLRNWPIYRKSVFSNLYLPNIR